MLRTLQPVSRSPQPVSRIPQPVVTPSGKQLLNKTSWLTEQDARRKGAQEAMLAWKRMWLRVGYPSERDPPWWVLFPSAARSKFQTAISPHAPIREAIRATTLTAGAAQISEVKIPVSIQLACLAVTRAHAEAVSSHLRAFYLYLLQQEPPGVDRAGRVAAFLCEHLPLRPHIRRITTINAYAVSLALIWPKVMASRKVSDAQGGLARCQPLRPPGAQERHESMTVGASRALRAKLPDLWKQAIRQKATIQGMRMWSASRLLMHGFRPVETVRALQLGGLAEPPKWITPTACLLHLSFSKTDRRGAAVAPPERPVQMTAREKRVFLRVLAWPIPDEKGARDLEVELREFWRGTRVASMYAFRHAAAERAMQAPPPGVSAADAVRRVLDHKPSTTVYQRYTLRR